MVRHALVARANEAMLSAPTVDLLVVLLALLLTSILAVGALFIVRRHRRSKREKAGLPLYSDGSSLRKSNHRRLPITASPQDRHSKSRYAYSEKQELLSSTLSPSPAPVPEIRITFPEEVDDSGKARSGRVVVVHVGEKGNIGLEPLQENLPAYQKNASDRFQSLDLERIGGLKEKV